LGDGNADQRCAGLRGRLRAWQCGLRRHDRRLCRSEARLGPACCAQG
jgi:hypothetical protein